MTRSATTTQVKPVSRAGLPRILREALPELRDRYGVTRLALHGSFAHGRPARDSDVDPLVESERPLGLEFVELVCELEEKLGKAFSSISPSTLSSMLM